MSSIPDVVLFKCGVMTVDNVVNRYDVFDWKTGEESCWSAICKCYELDENSGNGHLEIFHLDKDDENYLNLTKVMRLNNKKTNNESMLFILRSMANHGQWDNSMIHISVKSSLIDPFEYSSFSNNRKKTFGGTKEEDESYYHQEVLETISENLRDLERNLMETFTLVRNSIDERCQHLSSLITFPGTYNARDHQLTIQEYLYSSLLAFEQRIVDRLDRMVQRLGNDESSDDGSCPGLGESPYRTTENLVSVYVGPVTPSGSNTTIERSNNNGDASNHSSSSDSVPEEEELGTCDADSTSSTSDGDWDELKDEKKETES